MFPVVEVVIFILDTAILFIANVLHCSILLSSKVHFQQKLALMFLAQLSCCVGQSISVLEKELVGVAAVKPRCCVSSEEEDVGPLGPSSAL